MEKLINVALGNTEASRGKWSANLPLTRNCKGSERLKATGPEDREGRQVERVAVKTSALSQETPDASISLPFEGRGAE